MHVKYVSKKAITRAREKCYLRFLILDSWDLEHDLCCWNDRLPLHHFIARILQLGGWSPPPKASRCLGEGWRLYRLRLLCVHRHRSLCPVRHFRIFLQIWSFHVYFHVVFCCLLYHVFRVASGFYWTSETNGFCRVSLSEEKERRVGLLIAENYAVFNISCF